MNGIRISIKLVGAAELFLAAVLALTTGACNSPSPIRSYPGGGGPSGSGDTGVGPGSGGGTETGTGGGLDTGGPADSAGGTDGTTDNPGAGDGGGGIDNPTEGGGGGGTGCLNVRQIGETGVVPEAGVQLHFRVMPCDGGAIRPLNGCANPDTWPASCDLRVVNNETGRPFGGGSDGIPAPVFQPSVTNARSVLVLDMSTTIVTGGLQDTVISAAMDYVDAVIEPGHQIAVVAFGRPSAIEVIRDFTDQQPPIAAALDGLRGSDERGSTDLYNAYLMGLGMLEDEAEVAGAVDQFMVIISDGIHEVGHDGPLREVALAARDNSGASIFVVGALQASEAPELAELADRAEHFIGAVTAEGISGAFQDAAARATDLVRSHYLVGVCTPVALGNPTLTIQAAADGVTGELTVTYPTDELTGNVSSCDPGNIGEAGVECADGSICPVGSFCTGHPERACCPDGTSACGGQCCGAGSTCVDDGGGVCVPQGDAYCGVPGWTCPSGTSCAEDSYLNVGEQECIPEGAHDCGDGRFCGASSANCFTSCENEAPRCCSVETLELHFENPDGTPGVDTTCSLCCVHPDFPQPALWADGTYGCCSATYPWPYTVDGDKRCYDIDPQ